MDRAAANARGTTHSLAGAGDPPPPGRSPTRPVDGAPHPARMYDYYLGGKDNLAADREAAELLVDAYPATRVAIRELRGFLTRATAHLAGEAGVRQFVDIGVGLPAAPNLHEVAQASQPTARVVYVDNDPIVPA